MRADYLFASAVKAAEQAAEKESPKPAEGKREAEAATKQSDETETAKGAQPIATNAKPENDKVENAKSENEKPEANEVGAGVQQNVEQSVEREIEQDVKQDRNQPVDEKNRPSKNTKEKAA